MRRHAGCPLNEPQDWCAHMHVVAKANGELRRVVNFSSVNAACRRQTHHTPAPFTQAQQVPAAVYMTVCDAWNGFNAVPVHKDDRKYLSFLTKWGRYRYLSAPQGFLASGDAYTHRYDKIIRPEMPDYVKQVDNILQWASSVEQMYERMFKYLQLVGNKGIILNPAKFRFSRGSTHTSLCSLDVDSGTHSLSVEETSSSRSNSTESRGIHLYFHIYSYTQCQPLNA